MSTKLHNRIQTHIDPYEGEIITTDGKPPVNAKLTNLKLYGKSVQNGTPTPETPVPIESVPHNPSIISSGKNLANWKRNWYDASGGVTSIAFRNEYDSAANCLNIKSNSSIANSPGILIRVKPNTNYTFSTKLVEVIDTGRVRLSVRKKGTGEYYNILVKQSDYTSPIVGDVYDLEFNSGDTDIILLTITGSSNLSAGNILCKCDNIYLYEGSIDEYKDYISSTAQLNLLGAPNAPAEWIGQPIELMSLPDGTADEYRAGEGVVIKRIATRGIGTSGMYQAGTQMVGYTTGFIDNSMQLGVDRTFVFLCNMLDGTGAGYLNNLAKNYISPNSAASPIGNNLVVFRVQNNLIGATDEEAIAERLIKLKTYLNDNGMYFTYPLETPITIPVVPQPTPKSVYTQPNNIYADTTPQPTISCGVRKLGNRPYIQANLKDELGNFLVDENGNNIGGLY